MVAVLRACDIIDRTSSCNVSVVESSVEPLLINDLSCCLHLKQQADADDSVADPSID
jgi:hypothetical protein